MRNALLLGARIVVGGYMIVHGAQKMFGAFGGPGLEKAGGGFEKMGVTPGKPMAALAAATELSGGALTIAGAADPAGPLAVIGAMTVATAVHWPHGPMASKGGYELSAAYLGGAAALAATGPGRFRLTPPLPRALVVVGAAGGAVLAGATFAKLIAARRTPAEDPAAPES